MTSVPCPRTAEAVGWALHSLEPDEEMAVLVHLPQCPVCRAAVHDVEQVAGHLGAAVEQVDPPASLRERIVERAAETPRQEAVLGPRVGPEVGPIAASSGTSTSRSARHRRDEGRPATARPPERPSRRGRLSPRARRALTAALALVGVLGIGGLAAYTVQLEQERDAAVVQAQNAVTQARSVAEMMSQVDQPGTSHAVLATSHGEPVGAVLVTEEQRRLVTVGLPANAIDRETYVLWGIRDETPVPIGTFDVGTPEPESGTLRSPAEADGFSAYAISLEPGRIAPATPTTPVASGQVET